MAARRKRGSEGPTSVIEVRRRAEGSTGLRKLPPDLEDLAAGRSDTTFRPRRRPRGGRIADSRIAGLIAGVANHEARRVYDARVERLRQALAQADDARLERELSAACLLGVWRARNVTGFEAFAQDVVGLDPARARELADRGAAARGVGVDRLPDLAVALWLRSEAALLERCPEAEIEVRAKDEQLSFSIALPIAPRARVADALNALSRATAGLARVLIGDPPPPQRGR